MNLAAPFSSSEKSTSHGCTICVQGLHKAIGEQKILRGVDLELQRGETLALIGSSGGGKSVLLKNIMGLMKPDAGDILVEGQSIVALRERELGKIRKTLGFLFQNGALFDSMTVADNVAFPLLEAGERDRQKIHDRVRQALRVVELEEHLHKMPVELSGGMKKRVALARAIINRPRGILYDEPTAGLDPVVADSIDHLIRRLQKHFHVTSIVITHDMKSVYTIADRVAYLREGKIYFTGTPEELRRSEDEIIQNFIQGRSQFRDEMPE